MEDVSALPECQLLRVPKAGNSLKECEDAGLSWFGDARADDEGRTVRPLYAAVSDGASESLLAGAWAERLVADAVESMSLGRDWWDDVDTFVVDLMERSAPRWEAYLEWYRAERDARGRPITWYEQPGLEKGAFATVLGAEVRATVPGNGRADWSWHAFALGDSCLFHVRDGVVRRAFPLEDVEGFGITPSSSGAVTTTRPWWPSGCSSPTAPWRQATKCCWPATHWPPGCCPLTTGTGRQAPCWPCLPSWAMSPSRSGWRTSGRAGSCATTT